MGKWRFLRCSHVWRLFLCVGVLARKTCIFIIILQFFLVHSQYLFVLLQPSIADVP